MAPASEPQRPWREPLYDILTGIPHTGDVRERRRGLVLVASAAGVLAGGSSNRSIFLELRGLSPRDE
jgi:hypothetical protein